MEGGESQYLDSVEESAVVLQEGVTSHEIRRQRQFDVLRVQTLADTSADKSKSGVLQRLLTQLLELHKLVIFVLEV